MSVKIMIAAIVLILLFALGFSVYKIGDYRATAREQNTCHNATQSNAASLAEATSEAERKGRKAQELADSQRLSDLRLMLKDAQSAAASAVEKASKARSRADSLSNELERLRNENPKVDEWERNCLPDALLASLHSEVAAAQYPRHCRRASGGDAR